MYRRFACACGRDVRWVLDSIPPKYVCSTCYALNPVPEKKPECVIPELSGPFPMYKIVNGKWIRQ